MTFGLFVRRLVVFLYSSFSPLLSVIFCLLPGVEVYNLSAQEIYHLEIYLWFLRPPSLLYLFDLFVCSFVSVI